MKIDPITIYIARHGNTFEDHETPRQIGVRTDLPLTEKGRAQAVALAKFLQQENCKLSAIYSSRLLRQSETAQIVAQQLNSPQRLFLETSELLEVDYGNWEGLTNNEISQRWPSQYQAWNENSVWPIGLFAETESDVVNRAKSFLSKIQESHALGDCILAISSNGLLRCLYNLANENEEPAITAGQRKVSTGGVCKLQLSHENLLILDWNLRPAG